jgi:hypothetical protein
MSPLKCRSAVYGSDETFGRTCGELDDLLLRDI